MTDFEFSKRFYLHKTFVSQLLELIKTKIVTKTHLNNAAKKEHKKENNDESVDKIENIFMFWFGEYVGDLEP